MLDQRFPAAFQGLLGKTHPRAGGKFIERPQCREEPLRSKQRVDDDAQIGLPAGGDPTKSALRSGGQLQQPSPFLEQVLASRRQPRLLLGPLEQLDAQFSLKLPDRVAQG